MAKIDDGQAGERTVSGVKGVQKATFSRIDDELIGGKDGRPDALRLRFHTDKSEEISLGVPLNAVAKAKLTPFVPVPEGIPYSEEGLRHFINGAFNSQVFYPDCWNGWVTSLDPKDFDSMARVWCPPGQHRGYLRRAHKFVRADGAPRVGFEFLSTDNRFASFTAPWPKDLVCDPDGADYQLGPGSALNPGVTMWKYFILFGLNWEKFIEELEDAEVLYSYLGADGVVEGYLGDAKDISPALTRIVLRHGAQLVQWNMAVTTQYGLGMERGATHGVEFVPVITEGDDFTKAVRNTLNWWHILATLMDGERKSTHICEPDGSITEEGRTIVGGLWRPVVDKYPAVTLAWDVEKSRPAMKFPITATNWSLGGVVALGLMAERLAKLDAGDIVNPAGLCATRKNDKIVPWVVANVPEFAAIKVTKEEEV